MNTELRLFGVFDFLESFYSFVDMGYLGIEMPVGGKTVSIELAPGLKRCSSAKLPHTMPSHSARVVFGVTLPLICWLGGGLLGTKPHDSAVANKAQPSTN